MYRIEFNGRILQGFDPELVRMEVGIRLRLRGDQVERLFSGQTVVLKKSVSEKNHKSYMAELRDLGLDAQLVPVDDVEPPKDASAIYKVVFWGKVLPGFERTASMAAVAKQLKLPPGQLMQIFSGVKVVLKRGVSAERGARLVVDLARLGMQIELEVEAPSVAIAHKPTPQGVPVLPSAGLQEDDPQYGALLRTACDLSGTPFAGYDSASATVQHDEPPASVDVPKVGFAAANTEGYLNCPTCGFYQKFAQVCAKCNRPMPVRQAAKHPVPVRPADPTIAQGVAARTVLVSPPKSKRHAAKQHSLHTLMQEQETSQAAALPHDSRYHLIVVIVLLALGGVTVFLLMNR